MRAIRSGRLEATCTVILVFGLWSIKCAFAQTAASATAQTGTTTVMMLTPHNDTGVCDERLSQLWLISSTNRQLVNVASGNCLSITADDVVILATCGNDSPAQTWTLFANGSLEAQSVPGEFLAVCATGAIGCDSKIMELISNDGQMVTVAAETDDTVASEGWEEVPPSTNGSLIHNFWGSTGTANASFSAAVAASAPWCMQRLTGVQLPSNMSAITEFQTFSTAVLTKAQAGEIEPTVVNTSTPYTVPPAPEAPSEDTATIESVGTAEVVPDVAEPAPPPPPPAASSGVYGTFLPVTDTPPVSPTSQK
ncbi:hypothetical protein WJX79_009008 [Trebouxia sp. C0005]